MTNGQSGVVHQSDAADRQTATLNLEVNVQRSNGMRGEADARLATQGESGSGAVRTAPPDGGCPSARTEANDFAGVSVRWARSWLAEVDEARKALDRAERIAEARRARAYSIPSPLGNTGPRGKGGVSNPMARVDEMIDGEAEDASYGWARDALALFDLMAQVNRSCLRGALLNGLDVAEMRYRLGASDKEICSSFAVSRSKAYSDLHAFIDYLDYLGPERAFSVSKGVASNVGVVSRSPDVGSVSHAQVYEDIESMCRECTSSPCD